jgi:filamentous hemagglutinin
MAVAAAVVYAASGPAQCGADDDGDASDSLDPETETSVTKELFTNQFPDHQIGAPIQEFSAVQTRRSTFNRHLNYVVLADGKLLMGRINNHVIGGGHIDLAGGDPVRAAGVVTILRGQIKVINNNSGHYKPSGAAAKAAAEKAFNLAGFDATGKYVELPF